MVTLIPKVCRLGARVMASMALTAFLSFIGTLFLFSWLMALGES